MRKSVLKGPLTDILPHLMALYEEATSHLQRWCCPLTQSLPILSGREGRRLLWVIALRIDFKQCAVSWAVIKRHYSLLTKALHAGQHKDMTPVKQPGSLCTLINTHTHTHTHTDTDRHTHTHTHTHTRTISQRMNKSSHTTQGGNVWTTYPQTHAKNMKWLSWNQASRELLSAGNELAHLRHSVKRECLLWIWVGASWTDSRSVSTNINRTVTVTYTFHQSKL